MAGVIRPSLNERENHWLSNAGLCIWFNYLTDTGIESTSFQSQAHHTTSPVQKIVYSELDPMHTSYPSLPRPGDSDIESYLWSAPAKIRLTEIIR